MEQDFRKYKISSKRVLFTLILLGSILSSNYIDNFEDHLIQNETIELSELENEKGQKESAEEQDEFAQSLFIDGNSKHFRINDGSSLIMNYMNLLYDTAIPPPKNAKPLV